MRPAQKPRPESRTSTREAFPAATETFKPVAGHQEVENLEADQIFLDFFSSLDTWIPRIFPRRLQRRVARLTDPS